MTGQGNATADNDVHSATVEIRSVNHRHFKLSLRMPEILNPMEPAIDRYFRTQIHRGSINVNIRIDSLATEAGYVIDRGLIASYLQDFRQAMNDPNLMLKPDTLIGLPGVLSSHEKDLNLDEPMQSLILEVVSNATEQLHHMKSTEGEQLATDLRRNMNTVMDNLKTVRIRAPEVLEQFAKKIADRVNRRLEEHQLTLDDRDLIREVADKNPDWTLEFLGDVTYCPESLKQYDNIVFKKKVKFNQLSDATEHWHAAWIPYKVNALTCSINPLKVREYIAMGLPVVSSAMPEVMAINADIRIYMSADDISDHLADIIETENNQFRVLRAGSIAAHTWVARSEQLRAILCA